jgi:hypothetical protein
MSYQVALKCVDAIFRGSPAGVVECLTLNGMLDTIDPSTVSVSRWPPTDLADWSACCSGLVRAG